MSDRADASQRVRDPQLAQAALARAARSARRLYVREGLSMPVWRAGGLMWLTPDQLEACYREEVLAPERQG
jgi:hypothetical protein